MATEARPGLAVVAPSGAPAGAQAGAQREQLRIVIVGHVDHGKSTLVGRLFHDTGSMPEGKVEAIKAMCARRGMPFEWAFLMDALQAERDQGITIDTAHIWFRSARRDYVIIDAPGHKEFLKNMITGAAAADAALLVIDVHEGVREQSRRHGYLLHLLGVRQVAVVANKMDLVGHDQAAFRAVERACVDYLASIGVQPTCVIPVAARGGDNVAQRSQTMPWYAGPTVIEALDHFQPTLPPIERPLRLPIQDVYKFDDRRIFAGRVESGVLRVGDRLLFSPSNKTARVATIAAWSAPGPLEAKAGQSVGVTLDEPLFVERGEIASHEDAPPIETDVFPAQIFWLGHAPLTVGARYTCKLATAAFPVTIQSIERVIDTTDLSRRDADRVERNEVAEVVIRARRLVALDEFPDNPRTGRFVLVDNYDVAGGGIVSLEGYADQRGMVTVRSTNIARVEHGVAAEA
ncbi:MAG: sulfate adenylyltransferase subunit 1, partial [Alphaproteobacteria bacterium]